VPTHYQKKLPTRVTTTTLTTIGLIVSAYLLGSISSAILLSKIMGFSDPRSEGSKNPGATNVLRIAGKKAAFFTLVGDCLKGLVPVLIAHWLTDDNVVIALTGFSAFLGHCFPLYFGFKGGKGVATAIAVCVGYEWLIGVIIIVIWLLFAKVFKISSLAAIISFAILPALIYWQDASWATTAIFALMSAILIWRHKGNIQRLLQGTEA
jgi:glycerol-3-phosphate acyltransferase PlsY